MASEGTTRITIRRAGNGAFELQTGDGQSIRIGAGGCSPTELLLAALAASIATDIDAVVSRRAEPSAFEVDASTEASRGPSGNTLGQIDLGVRLHLPEDGAGTAARALAPRAAQYSTERTSAIAKAIQAQTPISVKLE